MEQKDQNQARQDAWKTYEEQYLRRQGQRPRRKPADTIGVVEEFARKRPRTLIKRHLHLATVVGNH